jgi:hypothetical protein
VVALLILHLRDQAVKEALVHFDPSLLLVCWPIS